MAASSTVPQVSSPYNPTTVAARCGVLTLSGYGVRVRVDRGHLAIEDGIASDRRHARLPRVGHGLKRLVVIGSDGMVSLAALRWLADQKAAFVLLDRDGDVLLTSAAAQSADGRLRRAQALALTSGAALPIVRMLIDQKLAGQERLAGQVLKNPDATAAIAAERVVVQSADTTEAIRWAEARAALAYWSAWHDLPVQFPRNALARVPDHWRRFGARRSPLTGSPRVAVNPPNAILNYLYALLEAEARLSAIAVGLDPTIGLLHADTDSRASLACDLMEAVRPTVDAYVLDWLTRETLRREWFFERRDGSCRLMAPFASLLTETMAVWARAVAPVAESVASILWKTVPGVRRRLSARPTPLTQRRRREAKNAQRTQNVAPMAPPRVCRSCGSLLQRSLTHCDACHRAALSESFPRVMAQGRIEAQRPKAQARRAAAQRRHGQARSAWNPDGLPDSLTCETYARDIRPRLLTLKAAAIARALGVSESYAAQIRTGARRPHARHWLTLDELTRVRRD